MKTSILKQWSLALLTTVTLGFTSCTKDASLEENATDVEAAAIAVAAAATTGIGGTTGGAATDSVYVMHECSKHELRAAIAESSLPAAVATYLTANYNGYTFFKALAINETDAGNTLKGYIVIIYYNDKPVALRFHADGTFSKVLEQREKKDIRGKGWHLGGRFQNRNGLMQDSIALGALPANIVSFFKATYSGDTLTKAFRVHQGGYLLLSVNNGVYATAFNTAGAFFKRVKLHARDGKATAVEASALPAPIVTYLTSTYPGYVFNRAFAISTAGTLRGYVVVIDANSTRYGLAFDANGNFEAAKVIK